MEVGEPLPSTRTMARILGLEHSVVSQAYALLRGLGYVQSIRGSYVRVRKKAAYNDSPRDMGNAIDWGSRPLIGARFCMERSWMTRWTVGHRVR
jgi:DNA-binding transcriptional MocR family regulator